MLMLVHLVSYTIFFKKPLKNSCISVMCDYFRAAWVRILVQVTIYRRLRIGRGGQLNQS